MIGLVNVRFNPAGLSSGRSHLYRFFVVARHLLIDYRANSSGVHQSPVDPDRTFPIQWITPGYYLRLEGNHMNNQRYSADFKDEEVRSNDKVARVPLFSD